MNLNRLFLPAGVVASALFSACVPYPPNPDKPLPGLAPDPVPSESTDTVTSAEQEEIRKAREKARRERAKKKASEREPVVNPDPVEKPKTPPPSTDFRRGVPIPGKEGFVFNPYTNNAVDVRGIPPGTLVRDPNDADPDHKFRVP